MAYQEVILKLIVKDGEVERATKEIEKLGHEVQKVEKTSKKAGSSLEDSFNDAGKSADNLNSGVTGIIQQIKLLVKSAKIGGAALRSALIATGIGALVVGLGMVVAHWDSISKFIGLSDTKLQDLIDTQNRYIDDLDFQLKLLREQEKTLKLLGESTVENRKEQEKQIKLLQAANIERLGALKLQLETETSQAKELTFFQKLLNLRSGAGAKVTVGAIDKEEQTRLDEIKKQIQDTKIRAEQLKQSLIEINQPEIDPEDTKKRGKVSAVDAGVESGIADPYNEQKQKDALRLQALQEGTEEFATLQDERLGLEVQQLERFAQLTNEQIRIEEEAAKKRFEIEQILTRQKQEQNDVRFDSANRLAGALMSLGEESKAAAVAGIIVDQVAGAAQAIQSNVIANAKAVAAFPLTAGQPWVTINTASTIAGIAAGALAAKKAISEIGGSGSVGSFGVPQGQQASAPSFNVVGTSGINQLGQSLANDETPIRAYVVGGDVTSQQEFDRNLLETSSI